MSEGVVIKSTGSWYRVQDDAGDIFDCKIRGKLRLKGIRSTNPVAVGDRVTFTKSDDGPASISAIHPRRNYIVRKSVNLSHTSHILAANIDQAILVVTLKSPLTLPAFVDRYLVTAEAYHIPAVLVFNKVDLYNDDELEDMRAFARIYENVGYPCLEVSATSGIGKEDLKSILKDKVSLLSGHSGVGKSTMINSVDEKLNIRTSAISTAHSMGQHTTTFAEMHRLSFGGYVIDTPGIKGFGLVDFDKNEIAERFPEMRARMSECKYNNCVHVDEPHCAVKAAVENDEIAWSRYESYLKLYFNESDESYRKNLYE